MRSRVSVLLALAALGALVAVLAAALVGGTEGPPPGRAATPLAETAAAEQATPPASPATPAAPARFELRYDDRSHERLRPRLSAPAYIAIDAETGEVLAAGRETEQLPIASLTKVMTALLVIEDGGLGRKVQVPRSATMVEPNREGLVARRWYPRRLLLYSTLLVSANDSADTLARGAGGSLRAFYRRMNARAGELGMEDTHYHSASGLEDERNYSTAADQALLAREALANRTFARIVRTKRKLVEWPPPTYAKEWLNHNKLLFTYDGAYGVKTGYTRRAGGCLIAAARRGDTDVIAVVLGSHNIWVDMPRLLDEAFARARRS